MLAAEHHAVEVGSHHLAPVFEGELLGVAADCSTLETGDAGVVHERVQSPVPAEEIVNRGEPLALFANVEMRVGCVGSESCGGSAALLVSDVAEHNEGSLT